MLYCAAAYIRYRSATPKSMDIAVISIGNLTVGGSGKTPLILELAKKFDKPAIVLRGYGRRSRGTVVVKEERQILCDTQTSGDEAMLYARSLAHAIVIVSEKREAGIEKAREMGCEVVFLDDGYGKHQIEKLDLLIDVPTVNSFCLPSGPYREKLWPGKQIVPVRESVEFSRYVQIENPTSKMVLVTAIARPQRLDPYLPEVMDKIYFEDHHFFTERELREILDKSGATSLLVTEKDLVKIASYGFEYSVLKLSLQVDESITSTIKEYVYATKNRNRQDFDGCDAVHQRISG